jgi:hypothetical protein
MGLEIDGLWLYVIDHVSSGSVIILDEPRRLAASPGRMKVTTRSWTIRRHWCQIKTEAFIAG